MNNLPIDTYSSFADELEKIAYVRRAASAFREAIRKGWSSDKASWMGKRKFTKYLPVGDKSLTVGGTAIPAAATVAGKEKDTKGRSKTERLSRIGGSAMGGLAGLGAVRGGRGWLARAAGGIAGSIAGDVASGSPWIAKRKLKGRKTKK